MGRLEDLEAFARVVDARGFSGAARLLGTSKSAVSKQVVRLEDQLGTRLLHRTTRSVSPTAEGHAVYTRAPRPAAAALPPDRAPQNPLSSAVSSAPW